MQTRLQLTGELQEINSDSDFLPEEDPVLHNVNSAFDIKFTLAFSLKQETLNAVSLACAGFVRKRSAFSTTFALGEDTWREWKADSTCLQVL